MKVTSDIIIIGGGCSGLALAYALAKQQSHLCVNILEARPSYHNDKTWCFWSDESNEWTDLAQKNWQSWSFHAENDQTITTQQSTIWKYYCLAAEDYYQFVQQHLKRNQNIKLFTNQQISSVTYADESNIFSETQPTAQVTTQNDEIYNAKLIIDTRSPLVFDSILYQSFYGLELKSKDLKSETVSLMHNMRSDDQGFRFNYILPLGNDRVLFEHTRFSRTAHSRKIMNDECDEEIRRLNISYRGIIREEYGCLPMGLTRIDPKYYQAGIAAGALRDASGFGFLRIQQWAKHIAKQLANANKQQNLAAIMSYKPHETTWTQKLDHLFLKTIRNDTSQTPQYFQALAKHLKADTLIRFLCDQASQQDLVDVIRALPKWPFLKQLVGLVQKKIDHAFS